MLQSGEFQRVGDAQTFRVDVRVIAATNRPLEQMIERDEFRKDLYYRLNVVPLTIPPLRERPDDIPPLIDHFLARIRERTGQTHRIPPETFELLRGYAWPGNIRELENALEHACVMCDGETILPRDLPLVLQNAGPGGGSGPAASSPAAVATRNGGSPITLEELEKQALVEALEATGYNHTRAAKMLGITRRTLGYRITKYDIPRRPPLGRAAAANPMGSDAS